jgi:hypothetical protein
VRRLGGAALDAAPVIVQDPAAGLVVDCIGAPPGRWYSIWRRRRAARRWRWR